MFVILKKKKQTNKKKKTEYAGKKNSLKNDLSGVPLLNFEQGPGVPLLNFGMGSWVPTFKLWGRSRIPRPGS